MAHDRGSCVYLFLLGFRTSEVLLGSMLVEILRQTTLVTYHVMGQWTRPRPPTRSSEEYFTGLALKLTDTVSLQRTCESWIVQGHTSLLFCHALILPPKGLSSVVVASSVENAKRHSPDDSNNVMFLREWNYLGCSQSRPRIGDGSPFPDAHPDRRPSPSISER